MQSRKTHKKGPAAMSGGASVSKAGRWGRGAEGARHKINAAAVPWFRSSPNFFVKVLGGRQRAESYLGLDTAGIAGAMLIRMQTRINLGHVR